MAKYHKDFKDFFKRPAELPDKSLNKSSLYLIQNWNKMVEGLYIDSILKPAQKKTIDEIAQQDPMYLTLDELKGEFIIDNKKVRITSKLLDVEVGNGRYYGINERVVPYDLALVWREAENIYESYLRKRGSKIFNKAIYYINNGNLYFTPPAKNCLGKIEHSVLENITTSTPIKGIVLTENFKLVLFVDRANIKSTRCVSQFQQKSIYSHDEILKLDIFFADGRCVDHRNIFSK